MTKRVEEAIDIFLDAINNGTLAKGTCHACAVGNLVGAKMGLNITIPNDEEEFCLMNDNMHWILNIARYRGYRGNSRYKIQKGLENIKCTGFSLEELSKIEKAFEKNTVILWDNYDKVSKERIRKDQIRGLEAVIKVMLTFDDCQDDIKEIFTNKAELIPV